jgi:hypothetical protein
MKYNVGDLVLIKDFEYKSRPRPRLLPRPRLPPRLRPRPELFNSFGIVTQAIKHSDIFEKGSTKNDNCYVWFSQIDGTEYCFCEDEVIGEIVK